MCGGWALGAGACASVSNRGGAWAASRIPPEQPAGPLCLSCTVRVLTSSPPSISSWIGGLFSASPGIVGSCMPTRPSQGCDYCSARAGRAAAVQSNGPRLLLLLLLPLEAMPPALRPLWLSLVRAAEACPVGAPSGVVAALAALSSAVGGTRPLLSSGARAASRLGGSRVCVRRCDVPAREHARRPAGNRKQKGLGFVSIRLLWRLAKRAKRLSKIQNVTALNHRPRRSGSGAGTEPWTGRSTSSWRCPEPGLIYLPSLAIEMVVRCAAAPTYLPYSHSAVPRSTSIVR